MEEIARMLSGERITDAARKAAESLFKENKNIWLILGLNNERRWSN